MLKRYNITQLARETGRSRNELYKWIRKGWLLPDHITDAGRMYFSEKSFIAAEQKSVRNHKENMFHNNPNRMNISYDEWLKMKK